MVPMLQQPSSSQAGVDIHPDERMNFGAAESTRDGWPEACARTDAAHIVREQMLDFPGTVQMPVDGLELYVVPNFVTPGQCAELVAIIDATRIPSPVVSDDPVPEYRTSETCYLYPESPVVAEVESRLSQLTGIDPIHGELLQGQRYSVGQEFKTHHDFFHTDQRYWLEQVVTGGQRTWSAMAFLNEPDEGGRTNFPIAGIEVTPRTGNLLIWNNMDERGWPNHASLHQGMLVGRGMKYVLTKWYRERPWCR